MNNKGQIMTIAIIIGGLLLIMGISIAAMIGWGAVKEATDIIIPELASVGEVQPGSNFSEYAAKVTTPTNTIIQNIGLFVGFLYIIGILGILTFAYIFRTNLNGWVIALFVVSVMLLIACSILLSNGYENFHDANDDIGETLRSETLTSFLIINSPVILTLVSFIAGIILFTGGQNERFYV